MFRLIITSGVIPMSILTVLQVAVFFAAWKAPQKVKEIGILALMFAIFKYLTSLYNTFTALFDVASTSGEDITGLFDLVSPTVFYGSCKVSLVSLMYGVIIYMVSLVIRIIQKPKI